MTPTSFMSGRLLPIGSGVPAIICAEEAASLGFPGRFAGWILCRDVPTANKGGRAALGRHRHRQYLFSGRASLLVHDREHCNRQHATADEARQRETTAPHPIGPNAP
nr:hypothetical protein [Sphingobium sp. ba1]